MNCDLSYSLIILKSQDGMKDYAPTLVDPRGNIIQTKNLDSPELQEVVKELSLVESKRLSSINYNKRAV